MKNFNGSTMKCFMLELNSLRVFNPMYGDFKLQVFPIDSRKIIILPDGFKIWENQINDIINKYVPHQKNATTHYLTIDSKFFTEDAYLRREGVHIDGNFCADPNFQLMSWGGTWAGALMCGGNVVQKFASPYNFEIPIGEYVSENKGGIICVSSLEGCDAWTGDIPNEVGNEGSYDGKNLMDCEKTTLKANTLYFMSSNTPHETTLIKKGNRRTLIRITLNHNYDNSVFLNSYIKKAS